MVIGESLSVLIMLVVDSLLFSVHFRSSSSNSLADRSESRSAFEARVDLLPQFIDVRPKLDFLALDAEILFPGFALRRLILVEAKVQTSPEDLEASERIERELAGRETHDALCRHARPENGGIRFVEWIEECAKNLRPVDVRPERDRARHCLILRLLLLIVEDERACREREREERRA